MPYRFDASGSTWEETYRYSAEYEVEGGHVVALWVTSAWAAWWTDDDPDRRDVPQLPLAALPASIGDLVHLRKLFLGGNALAALPASIGNLVHLEEVAHEETDVGSSPTKRRMWAERGHPPIIRSPGGHKHLNMMGAVDPAGGEVVSAFVEEMNARVYIKFLCRVLWRYKPAKKIYIITDNAKIHHAIIVNNFLASINHKIELLYIPPYSPELNPMEQVWKYMRESVTHNTFYPLFQDLKDTLRQFFENLKIRNDEVRSRCSFY